MDKASRRISSCLNSSYRPAIKHSRRPNPYRTFIATHSRRSQENDPFFTRLKSAWNNTRIQWYSIPVGAGIAFLGATQLYKVNQREQARIEDDAESSNGDPDPEEPKKPKKRKRIRPSGPWSVQIMSTLPLKAFSRLWGKFNELTIPYYLRAPGFKLYSFIFGVKYVFLSSLLSKTNASIVFPKLKSPIFATFQIWLPFSTVP
jgi:phosphatidylserine decarboxylase